MTQAFNTVGQRYERPWGHYTTVIMENNHQVKTITVNPGGRLSLQSHHHRAEHWVVVTGKPTVTVGDSARKYDVNEAIYIPLETKHRLENFTDAPVVIIEVQVGDYLGEDDIVRYDDVYNR